MNMVARSLFLVALLATPLWAQRVAVDLGDAKLDGAIEIRQQESALQLSWATQQGWTNSVSFNLDSTGPLIGNIEVAEKDKPAQSLARNLDVQYLITTGSRKKQPGNLFTFFDNPASRPKQRHEAVLRLTKVKVRTEGFHTTLTFSSISAGPFSGDLLVHFYAASPLVRIEAAMKNEKDELAYIYDALLAGQFQTIAWKDLGDRLQHQKPAGDLTPVAVRFRTMMAEAAGGTIALFPPAHSWFFPRDRTDNLKFAQFGQKGFGLRQDPSGGGAFVPWIDAPAGKTQRMDFFLLLSPENAEKTLARVAEYTHNDSFKPLPGYLTFTSHWHSRLTVAEMAGKSVTPEFVKVMKAMNVNLVHLAEFHGDGNPDDPGPKRLPQLKAMFDLCQKYSDEKLLLIPGEEGNKYLGNPAPREHPGHWMYLFPKPLYLTWVRPGQTPFVEEIEPYGKVYHVGSTADMVKLLEDEKGLAWTTHPRIKASYRTPDAFKDQDWYKSAIWLGAAWKAMPADMSEDRLGKRCLDLLDDMNQWGQRKYLPAEVDVFEIDGTHELYGHMNINYLKLHQMPKYGDWSQVLDVLRKGDFFSTTGEVLIKSWKITRSSASIEVESSFPADFVELIWGDEMGVHRQRHDGGEVEWQVDLRKAKWARLEVWDIARNGAFTQPVTPAD
jgi:hypothetical protein